MDKIFSIPDTKRLKYIAIYGIVATVAFTVIYGFCNSMATTAVTRYSLYTDWELDIPLIPWMIYPYLSLNLLFLISAFVIKDVSAIKGYCLGIVAGALAAGVIFYFFPGNLGFVRQEVPGYESIYRAMFEIDQPHNLFPSLHITYSSISIWTMIEQTRNKVFHFILWLWLILISMSVVFVHQHHLFDIVSGYILAIIVFKLVVTRYHPTVFKPHSFFSKNL
ncbi:phosphatase PAP2 family protein [Halobacteriovorax sp. HLS]|uniref:phosphatase PAP2 family protein n=1 Tax=Halobacteriovorax sp. HLS TaxID=2234000 RepID=UPI000FDAE4E2|nr:phosphatase PAP2 family protein [Halobacteriovorax sp. HLS]